MCIRDSDTVGHTVATPDGKIEYSSNDEVKASTQKVTYKAVSYTHLDVYKRQGRT